MKKQLPKPENWQDFETLCKKLWGEIWEIPNKIKKNGRQGQTQHGVDIYGIPKGQESHWGIQCKGKDEYTNAELTKKEINAEISKARKFNPELAVFIFATSANKDSKIEEYIRIKDVESRKAGGFEILLFCWEDIVDLIEENRNTYNFYIKSQNFKSDYDFDIIVNGFADGTVILNPQYYRTKRIYRVKKQQYNPRLRTTQDLYLDADISYSSNKKNLTFCKLAFSLENTGSRVIEDWKVYFELKGEYEEFEDKDPNSNHISSVIRNIASPYSPIAKDENNFAYKIETPLIQKDSRSFELWLKPEEKEYEMEVEWEILARDFDKKGTIKLIISPIYEDREVTHEVDYSYEVKESYVTIDEKKIYE